MPRRKLSKNLASNAAEHVTESDSDDSVSSGFLTVPRPGEGGGADREELRNDNDMIAQVAEDEVGTQSREIHADAEKTLSNEKQEQAISQKEDNVNNSSSTDHDHSRSLANHPKSPIAASTIQRN